MGIIDKLAKFFNFKKKTKTNEIIENRANLKRKIAQNMKNAGYNAYEINEVMEILKKGEEEIQIIKDSLIGSNINNPDVVAITENALNRIRKIELETAGEMREKIAEIKARKQK